MNDAERLADAVLDFVDIDNKVKQNGWTSDTEMEWEAARAVMVRLAHAIQKGDAE